MPDHAVSPAASIEAAIAQRRSVGPRRGPFSVQRPPGRYVAGEESALVGWLDKRRALPAFRIDKSVPLSVGRRPVLVHNAERWPRWPSSPATAPSGFAGWEGRMLPGRRWSRSVAPLVVPGVVEVELGTPVADIVNRAGVDVELSAVLVGRIRRSMARCLTIVHPYAPAPLAAVGAGLGVSVVIALPSTSWEWPRRLGLARYMAGPECRTVRPLCLRSAGNRRRPGAPVGRSADERVLERIGHRARRIDGRGACRHPDGVVRLVESAIPCSRPTPSTMPVDIRVPAPWPDRS